MQDATLLLNNSVCVPLKQKLSELITEQSSKSGNYHQYICRPYSDFIIYSNNFFYGRVSLVCFNLEQFLSPSLYFITDIFVNRKDSSFIEYLLILACLIFSHGQIQVIHIWLWKHNMRLFFALLFTSGGIRC